MLYLNLYLFVLDFTDLKKKLKKIMKFLDHGKMAATFVNLASRRAVRIVAREDARQTAKAYFPETKDKYECQLLAYKRMSDEELFTFEPVRVSIPDKDMPGRPLRRVPCDVCGEYVQDMREITAKGRRLCRACFEGRYYRAGNPAGIA